MTNPHIAEKAFINLSQSWLEYCSDLSSFEPWIIKSEYMRNLSGGALILARDYGKDFSSEAAIEAQKCIEKAEALGQWGWLAALPWLISADFIHQDEYSEDHLREWIFENIDHHNSLYRGWVLFISWLLSGYIREEDVIDSLLANVANTLAWVNESWALAKKLYKYDDEGLLKILESWSPETLSERINGTRSPFKEQYETRIKTLQSYPADAIPSLFQKFESDCWETIAYALVTVNESTI